jgi:2-oxoacid:acceptor oxidoreductase gamma subunit (pyruvate/2-ketoisovalerate family)
MIEIRFHGRGGQGAVVASTILAEAYSIEGKWVQGFPFFGVERRGAPVTAYTRASDERIVSRVEIYEPDYVVVLDRSLMGSVDVAKGLKGLLLLNSPYDKDLEELDRSRPDLGIARVNATSIATRNGLGSRTNPIVNTAILGAFSKCSGTVKLSSILKAIEKRVPSRTDANLKAAEEAYGEVVRLR